MELDSSQVPFIFFGVIIFCGNVFLCALYFTNRSLRTITNKFVLSLAFCDTIIATIFIPLYIFHTKYGRNYVAALSSFGSLFNLLALTYERYIAIFHALRYFSIMSDNKVRLLMAEVWSSTILVTLFPLPWEITLSKQDFVQWNRVYVGILTTLVVLVTIVVFFTYIRIFKVSAHHAARDRLMIPSSEQCSIESRRSPSSNDSKTPTPVPARKSLCNEQTLCWHCTKDEEQEQSNESPEAKFSAVKRTTFTRGFRRRSLLLEIKAARIIAAIFVFNFVCWLPIIIINICDLISPTGQADYLPVEFLTASLYLFVINSLVNPFIYAFCKRDFRNVIRKRMRLAKEAIWNQKEERITDQAVPCREMK